MTTLSGCFPPFPPNIWWWWPNFIVFAKAEPSSPLGSSEEEDALAWQIPRAWLPQLLTQKRRGFVPSPYFPVPVNTTINSKLQEADECVVKGGKI